MSRSSSKSGMSPRRNKENEPRVARDPIEASAAQTASCYHCDPAQGLSRRHRMLSKRRLNPRDFEPEPSPVWLEDGGTLKPTEFFLRWWQQVAEKRFGDKELCFEAAQSLGYVWHNGDPIRFDYNRTLARASLGLPEEMPLVNETDNPESYQRLRARLLSERRTHGE